MDAVTRPAIAGVAGAVPAHSAHGGSALGGSEHGVPAGAVLIPGASAAIDPDELPCGEQKLDGSGPCMAPRIKGSETCIGHKRAREKQQKKGS